jgi:hypothetical protein
MQPRKCELIISRMAIFFVLAKDWTIGGTVSFLDDMASKAIGKVTAGTRDQTCR